MEEPELKKEIIEMINKIDNILILKYLYTFIKIKAGH